MLLIAAPPYTGFTTDTAAPQRETDSPVQRFAVTHGDDRCLAEQRREIAVVESNHADPSLLADAIKHGRATPLRAHTHHDHIGIPLAQADKCSTW